MNSGMPSEVECKELTRRSGKGGVAYFDYMRDLAQRYILGPLGIDAALRSAATSVWCRAYEDTCLS